jgi:uncharacterized integral membrane protein
MVTQVVECKTIERSTTGRRPHPDGPPLDTQEAIVTYALWIVQALLAVLFLMLSAMKLTQPLDVLSEMMGLPGLMVRGIGVAELLGALGLILPAVTQIMPRLVPLAATGLATVAALAFGYHLLRGETEMALFPLVVGLLAAFVAYGRAKVAPHGQTARPRQLAASR